MNCFQGSALSRFLWRLLRVWQGEPPFLVPGGCPLVFCRQSSIGGFQGYQTLPPVASPPLPVVHVPFSSLQRLTTGVGPGKLISQHPKSCSEHQISPLASSSVDFFVNSLAVTCSLYLPYHNFSVLGLTHFLSLLLWKFRCLPAALFILSHVLISIWGPQCPGRKAVKLSLHREIWGSHLFFWDRLELEHGSVGG